MNREEARRYMIQWQQELKDGGFPIDSDRIQSLRVAIEALHREEAEEKGYCHRIKPKDDTKARWRETPNFIGALPVFNEVQSEEAESREECNCVFSKPKIKLPKKAVEFNFSNVEVVVRCKDCKWEFICQQTVEHANADAVEHRPLEWCSFGERRE